MQDPARIRQRRQGAADQMLDAIEQLTDEHVRTHAAPWREVWIDGFGDQAFPAVEELAHRIDAAVKSLIGAKHELIAAAVDARNAEGVPA